MNYERPELLERLSGEYVLGVLRGSARRRFDRLVNESPTARTRLHRWEEDWSALSQTLDPIQPSPRVWVEVRRRIFDDRRAPARRVPRRLWQLAAAAGVVAVALIIGLVIRQQQPALQPVAVLGTDASHPLWQVERSTDRTALTIRTLGAVRPPADKAYELWALPRGGSPVSLGLLPTAGKFERRLTPSQRTAIAASDKVAVSIEPPGGSPTGSPTGPVIIVANIQTAG
jgi:anti-sigma-K factor RskA